MPADLSITAAGSLPGYLGSSPSSAPTATSLGFPYQRLLPPPLSAQVAPVVLSMGVVPGDDGGPGRLTVAIRPAELGTLQIITDRGEDGTARIAVFAERPETLQLLLRDAPTLETALRAAGVDEGGGLSLTFGLTGQGQGDRGQDAHGEPGRAAGRPGGADAQPAVTASTAAMARTSLLDLSL
jgi:flagellar hook-length control protein FliK